MNTKFLFAVCMCASMQVNAAAVSYFLDQSNDLDDGANYVQVTVSDSIDHIGDIEFTVEVLSDAFPTALSNFGMKTFYFNFDDSLMVDIANLADIDPSWTVDTNKNAGGDFGEFDFQLAGNGSNRTEILSFRITDVIGDTLASYALSEDSEYFAASIADYDSSVSGNNGGKFAGSSVVPLPASVWLFVSGLGFLGWKSRKNNYK